jgi:two-component system sensor histidine kinase BaeS
MHGLLLFLFAVAVVVLGILLALQKPLFSRLSMRIAALILASGPVAILILLIFQAATHDLTPVPWWLRLSEVLIIILGGPLALGLLATRFVRRPLAQFKQALTELEQSNYTVQLPGTDIREFDEVFSRLNELIKRLQREEKLRKELVSDASHELNTPLTVMIGQLNAMQDGKLSMTSERVVTLREEVERLAVLVEQLDAYTKARIPDIGKNAQVRVRECCERVVKQFKSALDEKNVHVKLDIDGELTVTSGRGVMQQILTNLIQNTLRYADATEVTITATSEQLVFADNGKGVPPEALPYLFERFYRVEKSRNRETGGLGLGLAIVRELAEKQGWAIKAESVGSGLSFTIRFVQTSV